MVVVCASGFYICVYARICMKTSTSKDFLLNSVRPQSWYMSIFKEKPSDPCKLSRRKQNKIKWIMWHTILICLIIPTSVKNTICVILKNFIYMVTSLVRTSCWHNYWVNYHTKNFKMSPQGQNLWSHTQHSGFCISVRLCFFYLLSLNDEFGLCFCKQLIKLDNTVHSIVMGITKLDWDILLKYLYIKEDRYALV